MVSFLILYGTGEGQTENVAARISEILTERGHNAKVENADEISPDLVIDDFEAVLIGASIHAGKHQTTITEFVRSNRDEIAAKPTGFFQVSLSSATEEGQAQAATYVEEFIDRTEWHPDRIGRFGGALRYSKYGFLKRLMMKQIAKRTMPDTDTSRDAEFTDWDEVDAFAADVAAFVEGRLGIAPPNTVERQRNE